MRILHIATSVVAQSASYRIHKGILSKGIHSTLLATHPSIDDKSILYKVSKVQKLKQKSFSFIENILISKIFDNEKSPFSTGTFSTLDYKLINEVNPDIIHLHWICGGCVSIKDFSFLSQFNIVWTLHDSWAFTGGCHIPLACSKYKIKCSSCEKLKHNQFFDLSQFIWNRKEKYYKAINMNVVTPSKWLARCARESFLFQQMNISVIENGINTGSYKPINKLEAKRIIGIDTGTRKIILFGAMNSTSDSNKGFELLEKAIYILKNHYSKDEIEIVVFGSNEPLHVPDFGFKTTYLGRLYDEISLTILYSAADVMVVPSKSENFPNTVLESMACGTPVVGFHIGGIPDMIEHKINGYLAQPYESEDLARGIIYVLEESDRWKFLSEHARKKIIENFDINIVAEKYIELYKEISNAKSEI